MQISKNPDGTFAMTVGEDELLSLNNALNEVCNGLHLDDFDTRIGAPRAVAEMMLEQIGSALDKSRAH